MDKIYRLKFRFSSTYPIGTFAPYSKHNNMLAHTVRS